MTSCRLGCCPRSRVIRPACSTCWAPIASDAMSCRASCLARGSRLTVGLLSVAVSITLGAAIGGVAAYVGGAWERLLMSVTDAALALPRLILLLALVSHLGIELSCS